MKRDMDLIRAILEKLEEETYSSEEHTQKVELDEYASDEINYHVALLHEAGLIYARNEQQHNLKLIEFMTRIANQMDEKLFMNLVSAPSIWVPIRLTSAGHDFLEAARDDTRWNKAKAEIQEKGGAMTISFMTAILIQLAKEAIGLP